MSQSVDDIIKSRRTRKVLADPSNPLPAGHDSDRWDLILDELLALAGHAPYHYPSHEVHRMDRPMPSIHPWRMYVLDEKTCRDLLQIFQDRGVKSGKVGKMLAIAKALIQVTWLPDPGSLAEGELFEGNKRNMEHIAATGAAIQNILLGATARNIPTYWSSGGKLKLPETLERMGIPDTEVPLGSVFLFPSDTGEAEVVPGALRGKGGRMEDWSVRVSLD